MREKQVRIYTRGGDKGQTGLFDNKRIAKDDIRVESYGTVDELISAMGLAKSFLEASDPMRAEIEAIQHKLFTVGAILATSERSKLAAEIAEDDILALENLIDSYMDGIDLSQGFIVPGSSKESAALHVARTICRRAERRIITLSGVAEVEGTVLKYVNRLSDVLFAMAKSREKEQIAVKF